MGSGASIGDLTAEEISEQVASLGNSYIPYKEMFLNNGVSGQVLEEFKTEEQINCLFTTLPIDNKIHQIALKKKLLNSSKVSINSNEFETRGVSIELFRAMKKEALKRNPDEVYWTMGRVSAEIVGNHEILNEGCRWGKVDVNKTLTNKLRSSLINTLLECNKTSLHDTLGLSYDGVVGERATVFISFAYSDNFIELVDALESFLENGIDKVLFWFDMFVNDQW